MMDPELRQIYADAVLRLQMRRKAQVPAYEPDLPLFRDCGGCGKNVASYATWHAAGERYCEKCYKAWEKQRRTKKAG